MNENDKNAGVLFEEDLFIYFKYHKDSNTVEVYKNGELISSGGGVTPEQLYEILQGYVSKPELVEALSSYLTQEDLEGYVTSEGLTLILNDYVTNDTEATDEDLELIKLDTTRGIKITEDGNLIVEGRLGQFSSEEEPDGGLYYPTTLTPELIRKNSFLISEATDLSIRSSRVMALFGGVGVTLKKTAEAGATTFEISNTFSNRFTCACARNGYMAIDEASAETNIVKITSVHTANNPDEQLIPYSGATESRNNIIITTDVPLSSTESLTKIRLYGTMSFDTSLHIGQGVGTGGVTGKGKLLQLGQGQLALEGNAILIGNGIFTNQNRCIIVGAQHINHVRGACLTGEGHDTVNGTKVGLACHGLYSEVNANTIFALGNGTSNTVRSNIFEVTDDDGVTGVIMNSPNGTKYKLVVADDGTLTTTAITE